MDYEKIVLDDDRQTSLLRISAGCDGELSYIPKRPAVLILPGGGYRMHSEKEAEPVALAYAKAGYHAFVLYYGVNEHSIWPGPLNDYEQAMALIRNKADEWHLYADKIAVVGFSAGGHLAAWAATKAINRPNAAVLGYPVIMKSTLEPWNASAPGMLEYVDHHTCPCFVWATRNDELVPVENAMKFALALAEHNVSFESHIYAYGPHGCSLGDSSVTTPESNLCSRVSNWFDDSVEWLKDMFGTFVKGGMSEPVCGAHPNGNTDEYLSVDCTPGYLKNKPEAVNVLKEIMGNKADKLLNGVFDNITLHKMGDKGFIDHQTIQRLNEALSVISNALDD